MFRKFAKILIKICNITCDVEGLENIDPDETYFVVANHRSIADIPIIASVLPLNLRIMAKRELFRIPLLGQTMWLYDFVSIDRRNRRNAVKTLKNAERKMKYFSFLVFPEGTRSRTEKVEKFKSGALWLTESGCKILPISLDGAEKIMKTGSCVINSGRVKMKIFPPTGIMENETRQELAERLHKIVSGGIE
ncbi:1-acyl-sn-glycerol-3-phosphate acyltransferase [bacterium]|nr:1-acyl-sn-glycerol-3-phosphate acyltransferase [bacterium]